MAVGKLYIVFNKWIRDPDTNVMPYKIGITKNTVKERYYELEIKTPGEFEPLLVYELEDHARAEETIHNILQRYHIKGEWFNANEEIIEHIKRSCELMGGKLVANEVLNEPEEIPKGDEPVVGDTITINNIKVPLYKDKYETIQDFVKRLLRLLYNNNLIPEGEIINMLRSDYSRDTFDLQWPIIQNDPARLRDEAGNMRYWTNRIIGEYFVCSQWWKGKEDDYRRKISNWIMRIARIVQAQ